MTVSPTTQSEIESRKPGPGRTAGRIRTATAVALTLGVLGSGIALAPSALAKGGGVSKSGACTAFGTWTLKAKADDAGIQVQAEVDTNVIGQKYSWHLVDNGAGVGHGAAVTVAPSGSFTVNRLIPNRAGTDSITFRAHNLATGNTCSGSVSL